MKCKNTITGYVFEIDFSEGKKLLEEFECFELLDATDEERSQLSLTKRKKLSVKERVMKSAGKEY